MINLVTCASDQVKASGSNDSIAGKKCQRNANPLTPRLILSLAAQCPRKRTGSTRFRTTCPLQVTVEWGFAHVAKQKEIADKEESAATVSDGEPLFAKAKPATKSLKKGKLLPKDKSRLPRRQKKARQKAAGRL